MHSDPMDPRDAGSAPPAGAEPEPGKAASDAGDRRRANPVIAPPAWAKDLRRLFDKVVEEPLPACFIELLSRLDADG